MTPRAVQRGRRALGAVAVTGALLAVTQAGAASAHPKPPPTPVDLQILSFNDYHGHLRPPAGSDGTLVTGPGTTVAAGGVEYLTTHLRALREGHRNSLTVAAGDLIGGSPSLSGLSKDEPSVESLDNLDLDVSSVGNHEFDEGVTELLRMQYGGCHPVEGCFDSDGYSGANFNWLAANVAYKSGVRTPRVPGHPEYGWWGHVASTGRTILPPADIKLVQGVPVGFIGMTLEGTPELVAQAGIQDVDFKDEVATANLAARDLRKLGVKAIVVLLHEGGLPPAGAAYDFRCETGGGGLSGPIIDIAKNLDASIDLLVTGHTHQPYTCDIPDPAGQDRWVTSASSFGRVITETNLKLDPKSRDVIRSSVATVNHAVTRDVAPAADQTATIAKWSAITAPLENRVVGSITADINRGGVSGSRRDVESPLGDLIADAQLAATQVNGAVLALMNPGGVRGDLVYAGSTVGEGDGNVTYGEAFTVQPFGNLLVTMTLTGEQIERTLEQQWVTQTDGSVRFLHLGVSAGVTYSWSASAPVGNRIDPASLMLNGQPIDPAASYRVTVNSFLADGGDGFTTLREGTDRTGGGVDLDALTAYLGANAPVAPPAANRVTPLP
jgi:2',3'-cyclic-nucleotide 2'-phosphodiesterase (5'-nucleotidase family)